MKVFLDPIHTTPEEFENGGFTLKMYQMFPSTLCQRNLKTQQSPVILDMCLRKTNTWKSILDNHGSFILEKPHFQNVFHAHESERPGF